MSVIPEADAPTKKRTVRFPSYSRISDQLRAAIYAREFAPGSRLKMRQLAKLYGVSTIPIREALQQLQGEGLVVIEPNRGAMVRIIDRELIAGIYDLREAIDGILARSAASVATSADIKRLEEIEAQVDAAVAQGEYTLGTDLGRLFHETIGLIARNEEAVKMRRVHVNLFRSFVLQFGRSQHKRAVRPKEHAAIIEAIARHDPDAAEAAARQHARNSKAAALALYDEAELSLSKSVG